MTKKEPEKEGSEPRAMTNHKQRKMPEKPQPRSALHQWSPAVNKAKADFVDKNKQKFACAVGPITAKPKSNTVA